VKILFVSGKGGVGKSTVAATLALKAAREGQRTLLVELGNRSFYSLAFKKNFTSQPQSWREGVDLALWDGNSCLREYAIHFLKSEALYKLFFENPVSKSLIQVAPGLSELSMLGKITSGPPRNVGPKLPYDKMVIDAFASGHFLALLRAPLGFAEAVRYGPMGKESREIVEILRDPAICSYTFVTLPEELPVQETLELAESFKALIPNVPPTICLNRWMQPAMAAHVSTPTDDLFGADLKRRRDSELHAETTFKDFNTWKNPWVLSTDFEQSVLRLAEWKEGPQ
jgi:anion-transporting  ArsA/GET3 family ATPase